MLCNNLDKIHNKNINTKNSKNATYFDLQFIYINYIVYMYKLYILNYI